MTAKKEIVTIIDMEDDSDSDTVIDCVSERVAHTVIDMEDDDENDNVNDDNDDDNDNDDDDNDDDDMESQADTDAAQDTEDEVDRGGGMEMEEGRVPEEGPFWRQVARDLWEHLLDLLEHITAHGFDRLIRREHNNICMVILWAGAIFIAYLSSVFYVVSSVKEADQNPVATTAGYMFSQVKGKTYNLRYYIL